MNESGCDMSIKFKLSRWDIYYSSLIVNFQQPYFIVLLILMYLFFSYSTWVSISPDYSMIARVLTVVIMCIPPIFIIFTLMALFLLLTTLSKNNEPLYVEQKWDINDDFLSYETEYSRSDIKWKSLKRIIPSGNYCFLYFSQMAACIIPKKAFTSDQEWKRFVEFCRSKMAEK